MNRKLWTVTGFVIGVAFSGSVLSDAEAGNRQQGFHGGWHDDYGRHFDSRYHYRNRHRSYGLYGEDSFSPNCHRYLMKTRWSGHRYWWKKYNRCIQVEY